VHGLRGTDREHVRRTVGEAYPGAGGRGLHDGLGVVGDGMVERLVTSRCAIAIGAWWPGRFG
jgi:hypothetical protein